MPSSFALLEFRPPHRYHSGAYRGRIWVSACGNYRIREIKVVGQAKCYTAERMDIAEGECQWDLISRHRSRRAALAALEKQARKQRRRP